MKIVFEPSSTEGQHKVLLNGRQIGALVRHSRGYLANMYDGWKGIELVAPSLPVAKDKLARKVYLVVLHAERLAERLTDGAITTKEARNDFIALTNLTIKGSSRKDAAKYLNQLAH